MSTTGFTIWITGLSGAGKSTLAGVLERRLRDRGRRVEVLDGDVVRANLTPDLGYSRADRDANVRRIGWVCGLLSRNDVVAIAAVISPYRAARQEVRQQVERFVEVYLEAPIEVLVDRDPKGLYRKATAGEIGSFTGISDDYEPPTSPEVTCHTGSGETPDESADRVIGAIERLGYLEPGDA